MRRNMMTPFSGEPTACYPVGAPVNHPYVGDAGPDSDAPTGIIRPRMDGVRIDKWLWAARFYKTRGAATEAVLGGRVHVNGERVKPAKDVHVDDRLELTIGDKPRRGER